MLPELRSPFALNPPLEGRANLALIAFLVELFSVPKNAVELVTGELSRSKVVLLRGVTLAQVEAKLADWIHTN